MKRNLLVIVVFFLTLFGSFVFAETPPEVDPSEASDVDMSYFYGYSFGDQMRRNSAMNIDSNAALRGVKDALAGHQTDLMNKIMSVSPTVGMEFIESFEKLQEAKAGQQAASLRGSHAILESVVDIAKQLESSDQSEWQSKVSGALAGMAEGGGAIGERATDIIKEVFKEKNGFFTITEESIEKLNSMGMGVLGSINDNVSALSMRQSSQKTFVDNQFNKVSEAAGQVDGMLTQINPNQRSDEFLGLVAQGRMIDGLVGEGRIKQAKAVSKVFMVNFNKLSKLARGSRLAESDKSRAQKDVIEIVNVLGGMDKEQAMKFIQGENVPDKYKSIFLDKAGEMKSIDSVFNQFATKSQKDAVSTKMEGRIKTMEGRIKENVRRRDKMNSGYQKAIDAFAATTKVSGGAFAPSTVDAQANLIHQQAIAALAGITSFDVSTPEKMRMYREQAMMISKILKGYKDPVAPGIENTAMPLSSDEESSLHPIDPKISKILGAYHSIHKDGGLKGISLENLTNSFQSAVELDQARGIDDMSESIYNKYYKQGMSLDRFRNETGVTQFVEERTELSDWGANVLRGAGETAGDMASGAFDLFQFQVENIGDAAKGMGFNDTAKAIHGWSKIIGEQADRMEVDLGYRQWTTLEDVN